MHPWVTATVRQRGDLGYICRRLGCPLSDGASVLVLHYAGNKYFAVPRKTSALGDRCISPSITSIVVRLASKSSPDA